MKYSQYEITVTFGTSTLRTTCETISDAYDIIRDVDNHTALLSHRGKTMDEIIVDLVDISNGRTKSVEYPGALCVCVCDEEV